MKSHELAWELLQGKNRPVEVSVDMSSGEEDSYNRVFGRGIVEVINGPADTTLVFEIGVEDNADLKIELVDRIIKRLSMGTRTIRGDGFSELMMDLRILKKKMGDE